MDTQRYIPSSTGAKLLLLENDKIRVCSLDKRPEWAIGRYDPGSPNPPQILFQSRIVSRLHGWLRNLDGQWYYVEEPKNLNGTFHNGIKLHKSPRGLKHPVPLEPGDVLRIDNDDLDNASNQGVLMLFTNLESQGVWTLLRLEPGKTVLIGRDEDCTIVEPRPYISAHHAQISEIGGSFWLSDCGSKAGTFLNGKKIHSTVRLREKDCISICDSSYFYLDGRLLYSCRNESRKQRELPLGKRPVILKADIETKRVKNNSGTGMKELIRDIHLEIREGTLVALLGTAGAGKTTVMNCLNGMDSEGVQGTVIYRGVDLMKNFDQMKSLIGSVPQKKTFHKTFTPEQEFRIAARKRLPRDTTPQEIEERVERTLEMLGMTDVRNNMNCKLSGGEQTRVNVGIELVADRDLLCLDEPDQGLSPNYKHELFEILQSLAHKNGKSVLTIIHDVSEINMFDQVIMLAKVDGVGRLAFSGSPREARKYFGVNLRDAYTLLEQNPEKYVR